MTQATPTHSTFAKKLNETFTCSELGDLNLSSVETLPDHEDSNREPFTLIFKSDNKNPAAQGIYELSHPDMGTLGIFLVPVGADDTGVEYEAIFN